MRTATTPGRCDVGHVCVDVRNSPVNRIDSDKAKLRTGFLPPSCTWSTLAYIFTFHPAKISRHKSWELQNYVKRMLIRQCAPPTGPVTAVRTSFEVQGGDRAIHVAHNRAAHHWRRTVATAARRAAATAMRKVLQRSRPPPLTDLDPRRLIQGVPSLAPAPRYSCAHAGRTSCTAGWRCGTVPSPPRPRRPPGAG